MLAPVSQNSNINSKYLFKNFKSKSDKLNVHHEKRVFVEEKTQDLDNLTLAVTVFALLTGCFNGISNKQKAGKWVTGFTLLALGLMFATCIKKYKLGKNFDKENM